MQLNKSFCNCKYTKSPSKYPCSCAKKNLTKKEQRLLEMRCSNSRLVTKNKTCYKLDNSRNINTANLQQATSIQHHICLNNLLNKCHTNITSLNIKCLCCCSIHVFLVAGSSSKRMLLEFFLKPSLSCWLIKLTN